MSVPQSWRLFEAVKGSEKERLNQFPPFWWRGTVHRLVDGVIWEGVDCIGLTCLHVKCSNDGHDGSKNPGYQRSSKSIIQIILKISPNAETDLIFNGIALFVEFVFEQRR